MNVIEYPVRFGRGFDVPSVARARRAKQKAEAANGKKRFTKEQLLRLVAESDEGFLKAAILLGINGGFGNTVCSTPLPLRPILTPLLLIIRHLV